VCVCVCVCVYCSVYVQYMRYVFVEIVDAGGREEEERTQRPTIMCVCVVIAVWPCGALVR
jgi:hypothetical protein